MLVCRQGHRPGYAKVHYAKVHPWRSRTAQPRAMRCNARRPSCCFSDCWANDVDETFLACKMPCDVTGSRETWKWQSWLLRSRQNLRAVLPTFSVSFKTSLFKNRYARNVIISIVFFTARRTWIDVKGSSDDFKNVKKERDKNKNVKTLKNVPNCLNASALDKIR